MAQSTFAARRHLAVGAVVLAGALALTGCGNAESKDAASNEKAATAEAATSATAEQSGDSTEKKELIVGYDNTFVPMGFEENGETKGFDVDLAKAAEAKTGLKFKFQNIDWSMKETELNTGKIDAIWNGYSITPERLKQVAATEPYMENAQLVLVLKDSPIKTLDDLKGKTIASQASSVAAETLVADKELAATLPGGGPQLYDTFDKALRDLEVGRADAVIGDSVLLRYYAKQKGGDQFREVGTMGDKDEFVIAVRQNDKALLDKLNGFLKEAKADGTLDTITKKWFN
ncbi:hypothetical protein BK816_06390 [Boudabousia tangfeifanii]|uniref:Solute-binding protein family 3/N-terminal domain-containing protein n=2 Tax=Boudabousia tangfeifanii TaxID=1912795 RepID=A0A1D9MMN6_9ACTO|nr:hypothetical protein BK816_06390 [Boudabousia tangfeifanii]